jgi:hypothetical protein
MNDYTNTDFDDDSMLIAALIADIEADKARVRIEYDNMKETYHRQTWRREGYASKGEFTDRMERRAGEILGFENALRTLYIAQTAREQRRKGSE